MKKIFKQVILTSVSAVIAVSVTSLCGCSVLTAAINGNSAKDASAENLLLARESIRAFNIAIDTQYEQTLGWFSRTTGNALGSGVVFAETETMYYALTNNHVITPVVNGETYITKYTVTDINGVEYLGQVEKTNEEDDIAIISFKKEESSVLSLANYTARLNTNMVADEFVLAVGNPGGVKNIVTYGKVISWATIENVDYSVIYHNALINPGNSGGALCDLDGNLLGLNTWGSENTDDRNFAIPLSKINEFISDFVTE